MRNDRYFAKNLKKRRVTPLPKAANYALRIKNYAFEI